jgi:hypothetical protein
MSYERINGYHDAILKGINASELPDDIVLSFTAEDGQEKSLTLHACEIFRATDFVRQNVVSRILLFRGGDIDTDSVVDKLRWASSLSDTNSYLSSERVETILAKIRSGHLSLLVIEPSCGAEIVALFAHLSA